MIFRFGAWSKTVESYDMMDDAIMASAWDKVLSGSAGVALAGPRGVAVFSNNGADFGGIARSNQILIIVMSINGHFEAHHFENQIIQLGCCLTNIPGVPSSPIL